MRLRERDAYIRPRRAVFALALAGVVIAGCAGKAVPGSDTVTRGGATAQSGSQSAQTTEQSAPQTTGGTPMTDTTDMTSTPGGDLFGRYGVISAVGHDIVPGTAITISFEGTKISVSAGCNGMGGEYRVEAGVLVVDNLIGTLMACDAPIMEQEHWVSTFLTARPTVYRDGETITLSGQGVVPGGITMHLTTVEPALPVDGSWTLSTIVRGDIASAPPAGVTATLEIDGESLVLDAGCNTMRATVARNGQSMNVPALVSTRMACSPEQTELETLFGQTFSGDIDVATEGARLRVVNSATATQLIWEHPADDATTAATSGDGATPMPPTPPADADATTG